MCPSFTRAVRDSVLQVFDLPVPSQASTAHTDFDGWWLHFIKNYTKEEKRRTSGIITYIVWGVWKERNRRVFTNTALPAADVVARIRAEIGQKAFAHSDDPGDLAV